MPARSFGAHLEFPKAHPCAGLVKTVRLALDKRMVWMLPPAMTQARACDSVRYAPLIRSMFRRGVPRPWALAYLHEARRASMKFVHGLWSTNLFRDGVGLRQGSSAGCFPFCAARLHGSLAHPVGSIQARHPPLQQGAHTFALADDTCFFFATRRDLDSMMCDLSAVAEAEVGPDTRWEKCSVAFIEPRLPPDSVERIEDATYLLLA